MVGRGRSLRKRGLATKGASEKRDPRMRSRVTIAGKTRKIG